MFSARSLAFTFLAVAAVSNGSLIPQKRQNGNDAQHGLFYCEGPNLGFDCFSQIVMDNVCTEPANEWNDNMLSAIVPLYTSCQFYADPYCSGLLVSVNNVPGASWQPYYQTNPSGASDGVSSFTCSYSSGATAGQQVLASGAMQAPLPEIQVYYTTDVWWEGAASSQWVVNGFCAEIPSAFNDAISSFKVTAGGSATCILYQGFFCSGTAVTIPYNGGSGSDNVNDLGDPDDATSFMCTLDT